MVTATVRTWDHPVSPPLDSGTDTIMARATELHETSANKISVPMQMFLSAAATIVVMTGAFYQVTGSLRSQNDIMIVKIDAAAELAKERNENVRSQMESMKDELKTLKGDAKLLQLQQQQLQLEIAKVKP